MSQPKKDIFQIVEQLEKTKEEIHGLLKDFATKGLSEKEDSAFAVMEEVLKRIGEGLYKSAKSYTGKDEMKFYFYPGYTTLTGKRVLIKGKLNPKDERDKPMLTGIGFIKNKPFFNCPSTLYYDAIVKDLNESEYLGPTTHHWKRQQDDSIDIKLKDKTPLKVLLIESSTSNRSSSGKGFYHIQFNKAKFENVVQFISSNLSPKFGLHKISDKERKYKEWPLHKPNDLNLSDERFKQLAEVQKLVYPVWFAATFSELLQSKSSREKVNKWIASITERVTEKGYYQLAERIKRYRRYEAEYLLKREKEYKPVFFSHWYSLFFDTKEHKQELGSAMILTDHQLPREFLFYVSSWLQQIYGLMRMEDYALMVRRNERNENFDVFHHNAKFHLNYIKQSIQIQQTENAVFATDFLRKIITLSKYALSPAQYLQGHKKEEVSLINKINTIIDVIKADVIHNNAELLKIGSEKLLNEIKERIKLNNLVQFELKEIKILSYPEIVEVVMKDIIANAIGHAVTDEYIPSLKGVPLVKIRLEKLNDNEAQFTVINHEIIPEIFIEAFETGLFDLSKEADVPWGVLITSNYCRALGYDIEATTLKKKPQTSISITFKNIIQE